MPAVTDDELGEPPDRPPPLAPGIPYELLHSTPQLPDLGEPPPPPPLTRSPGFRYSGIRRRPSPQVEGDNWISRYMARTNAPPREILFEPSEVPIPHTRRDIIFERPEVMRIHRSMEEDWWFTIPQKLRTDDFWKHMFAQPDFFLVDKKIDPEQKEAIDTIMSLLPIEYKGIYNTSTRRQPLKSPFPEQVNVAYVKHYLDNVRTTLSLTPEDRYRFEMILMNYLMFAPMKVLKRYIARIPRRGGKRRTRKYKTKRV